MRSACREVAYPVIPPAPSRSRSRRARSSAGSSGSVSSGCSTRGSAIIVSRPVATSAIQRRFTGSSPLPLRRNSTCEPSGVTVRLRGSPRVSRWVRAYWRGNVSITHGTLVVAPRPTSSWLPWWHHPFAAVPRPAAAIRDSTTISQAASSSTCSSTCTFGAPRSEMSRRSTTVMPAVCVPAVSIVTWRSDGLEQVRMRERQDREWVMQGRTPDVVVAADVVRRRRSGTAR